MNTQGWVTHGGGGGLGVVAHQIHRMGWVMVGWVIVRGSWLGWLGAWWRSRVGHGG